jgi:hypothetical protein
MYDQKSPSPELLRGALVDLGLEEKDVRARNKSVLREMFRNQFLEEDVDKEPTTEFADWEVDRLCDQLHREVTLNHRELISTLTKEEDRMDFSLSGTPVENRIGAIRSHLQDLSAISVNNELLYDVGQIRSDRSNRWVLQIELRSESRFGADYLCLTDSRFSLMQLTDQLDRPKYGNRWVYTVDAF